jgi:hypothetical protein
MKGGEMMKINKFYFAFFFLVFILLITTIASADPIVTLNKPVTLNGTYGLLRAGSGWDSTQPLGTASTINDGVFFTEATLWNQGTIWWDAMVSGSENNSIVIDLQGAYHITGIITQADNNDNYNIDYFDPFASAWVNLTYWPGVSGWGLVTRPNPDQITPFATSFNASQIRLSAFDLGVWGDSYYSYSEFQAFGTQIPEPATILLLGFGLIGLAGLRRKA